MALKTIWIQYNYIYTSISGDAVASRLKYIKKIFLIINHSWKIFKSILYLEIRNPQLLLSVKKTSGKIQNCDRSLNLYYKYLPPEFFSRCRLWDQASRPRFSSLITENAEGFVAWGRVIYLNRHYILKKSCRVIFFWTNAACCVY